MGKTSRNSPRSKATSRKSNVAQSRQFVLGLIAAARTKAIVAVNETLIDLYWGIGRYISERIQAEAWGDSTIEALADAIKSRYPGVSGYSPTNLWRMRQFFDAYGLNSILAPLVRELSWTHNMLILGRCKTLEAREFYLRTCAREKWSKRELARQLSGALFERTVLSPPILSPVVRELHPLAESVFKDAYLVEFLNLPTSYSEDDLHRGLVENLKNFLLELGRDFCFVGSEYHLQVGGRDFSLDLLFFHRAINCLVAIELKIDEFQPEYLGKLNFYLEALDRDVKKPHEAPAIGVLLCATKDNQVVEYALSRSLSPSLVAEYRTQLPDRKMLTAKLHEFYALAETANDLKTGIKVKLSTNSSNKRAAKRKTKTKTNQKPSPRK